MGLPPRIRRVTSCEPSLMVGNCGAPAAEVAAGAFGENSESTAAPAARPAACCRNCRRVVAGETHSEGDVISSGFIIFAGYPQAARTCTHFLAGAPPVDF